MRTILFSMMVALFFAGCFGNDISRLSKSECIQQGYNYKIQKRFNYRNGAYEIESRCYNKNM